MNFVLIIYVCFRCEGQHLFGQFQRQMEISDLFVCYEFVFVTKFSVKLQYFTSNDEKRLFHGHFSEMVR